MMMITNILDFEDGGESIYLFIYFINNDSTDLDLYTLRKSIDCTKR